MRSDTALPGSPNSAAELRAARERFLSDFALALHGEADAPGFLDWSVSEIGRLLAVDRTGLFLVEGASPEGRVLARATWRADGVAALPGPDVPFRTERVAEVFADFTPVVAGDVLSEPRLAPEADVLRRLGTKSALAVPIVLEGVPRGFLAAAAVRERREWSADETSFLQAAARHLSAALKQVELLEELAWQRDRLSVLFDVAAAVQRSTTQDEVIQTALQGLRETLGFRAAFLRAPFAFGRRGGERRDVRGGPGGTGPRRADVATPPRPRHGRPEGADGSGSRVRAVRSSSATSRRIRAPRPPARCSGAWASARRPSSRCVRRGDSSGSSPSAAPRRTGTSGRTTSSSCSRSPISWGWRSSSGGPPRRCRGPRGWSGPSRRRRGRSSRATARRDVLLEQILDARRPPLRTGELQPPARGPRGEDALPVRASRRLDRVRAGFDARRRRPRPRGGGGAEPDGRQRPRRLEGRALSRRLAGGPVRAGGAASPRRRGRRHPRPAVQPPRGLLGGGRAGALRVRRAGRSRPPPRRRRGPARGADARPRGRDPRHAAPQLPPPHAGRPLVGHRGDEPRLPRRRGRRASTSRTPTERP